MPSISTADTLVQKVLMMSINNVLKDLYNCFIIVSHSQSIPANRHYLSGNKKRRGNYCCYHVEALDCPVDITNNSPRLNRYMKSQ